MLSQMHFKGVWRDYQARILEAMPDHFANDRLHIVAAPGAGKTILGLEIVRRLGRPALVFAPTVAIRDQWALRFVPHFLDHAPGPEELSKDLEDPRSFTVTTYQALDAVRRAARLDDLIARLGAAGPLTLVLDEAHHLRREWWSSLERLTTTLPDVRIVALTATPPYDSNHAEWARYEGLCGPIDLEIGVPELVRNGDLCPHQDHVILSEPTPDALALLDRRRRAISQLQADLWEDQDLLEDLERHPWLSNPQDHFEAILETPELLSSILVLLAGAGRKLPSAPLKLLGVSSRAIPPPSFAWLEIFLDGVTATHTAICDIGKTRVKRLRDRLHQHGLVEAGRVRLREARSVFQLMASNLAKLDSIANIARAEQQSLGERLRMVILSDHIRAGELPIDADADFRPSKPGVVPIFEHLRREGIASERLGVLTGTLVILATAALPELREIAAGHGLGPDAVRAAALPACPGYVSLELVGAGSVRLVPLITELFTRGVIRILVGTQSLLGEGWDAPALNSLILASNTASFVLCNQMRGRAIRSEPGNPQKVANIWHLATVEPSFQTLLDEPVSALNWGALADASGSYSEKTILERRFRAFEGISNNGSALIESGTARLGLDLAADLSLANSMTFATASDREGTAQRWSDSLGVGGARACIRETAAPTYTPQGLAMTDTLQALAWSGLCAGFFAAADELSGYESLEDWGVVGMGLAGAAALAGVPNLAKGARLAWRNGSIERSLGQVGQVVLAGLAEAGLVKTAEAEGAAFDVRARLDGRKDIVLRGVGRSTERQVMQAIAEVLGPIENPRYLLVRHSQWGWKRRTDYHAVPAAIATRKAWAKTFAGLWTARVGSSVLVPTRTPEGRRVLLRARASSMAAGFQRSVDRRSAWL